MGKQEVKKEIVNNLKNRFSKSALAAVADYKGFTVSEITNLRKRLRDSNAEFKIAKNTLIKIAIKEKDRLEKEATGSR